MGEKKPKAGALPKVPGLRLLSSGVGKPSLNRGLKTRAFSECSFLSRMILEKENSLKVARFV